MPTVDQYVSVPAHLQEFLDDHAGHWTLIKHPDIEQYAVARLSASNVEDAVFTFVPRGELDDQACQRQALKVLRGLTKGRVSSACQSLST